MHSKKPYQLTYVYCRNNYNKYSYALNNPIRFTDPSGNDPYWVWENGQYVRKYENAAQRERIKKQREWIMNNAPDGKPTSETDFFKKMDRWMIRLENNISRLIESMFRKEEESKIITINGEKMVRVIDKATSLEQIIPLSNYNPEIQTALEIIHKEVEFKLLQPREKPHLGSTRNGENAQGGGDIDFSNSSLALDIGGGIYGGLQGLTSSQGYWLGKNGKYYSTSWGGNQYTGSRAGALKAANQYKMAGRATVVGSALLGGYMTYEGYVADGGQFGYNAQMAAASSAGSIMGGLAGAEAGALIGAGIGAWFGGVGAIPGAVIGGFVGGFGFGMAGGYYGGQLGGSAVNYYHGR